MVPKIEHIPLRNDSSQISTIGSVYIIHIVNRYSYIGLLWQNGCGDVCFILKLFP
jgi:hypothetical protein